jgi:hypothetical protein
MPLNIKITLYEDEKQGGAMFPFIPPASFLFFFIKDKYQVLLWYLIYSMLVVKIVRYCLNILSDINSTAKWSFSFKIVF